MIELTRHADVVAVANDWRTFTSTLGTGTRPLDAPVRTVHLTDPPTHTRMRAMLEASFGHAWLRAHADTARQLARDLFARHRGSTFDAVDAVARPIAMATLERFLGEPVPQLGPMIRRFARHTDEAEYLAVEAEVWTEIDRLIAARRVTPGDDVITRLFAERMPSIDLRYLVRLVLQTSYQTSELAMAAAIVHVREPVADAQRAADEVLRFSSPVRRFVRTVTVDTQLGGRALRAGQRVAMCFPEANRDPSVFANPDAFDATRSPNPHVAFGGGIHQCLGAALARVQIAAVIDAMPRLDIVETRSFVAHVNHGYERVVVRAISGS